MAATRSRQVSKKAAPKSRGRRSTHDAIMTAIRKLNYRSFDSYLFDRGGKTLASMADELGIPRPSFTAEHRRHMLEQGGVADPPTTP